MRHSNARPRPRAARLLALAAAALVVAGCGAPGYRFASNDADDLALKIPRTWSLVSSGVPPQQDGTPGAAGNWFALYDGSTHPDAGHLGAAHTTAPVAWLRTYAITKDQGQGLTDDDLRDLFLPVTARARLNAISQGSFSARGFTMLRNETLTSRTATGVHVVFTYDLGGGTETFDKVVMLDRRLTRVHLLLVQCSKTCYDRQSAVIADSIHSFTVRTA